MIDLVKNTTNNIVVTTIGITIFASFCCHSKVQAQSLINKNNLLVAQQLGQINRKIELNKVPTTVLSSARTVSGGEPTTAQVQINPDGSLVYELAGQNQQGFDYEMDIASSGQVIEIDEQVESSAVPEKVMKALKFWLPDAQVVSTWRSTRYTTFDYYYEIVLDNDFWVEIPADGKTLKINPLSTLHNSEN